MSSLFIKIFRNAWNHNQIIHTHVCSAAKRKRKKEKLQEIRKKSKMDGTDATRDPLEEDGAIDGLIAAEPEKVNTFANDGSFIEQALKKAAAEKAPPKWQPRK